MVWLFSKLSMSNQKAFTVDGVALEERHECKQKSIDTFITELQASIIAPLLSQCASEPSIMLTWACSCQDLFHGKSFTHNASGTVSAH